MKRVPVINGVAILLPLHSDKHHCLKGGESLHAHIDWRFQPGEPDMFKAIPASPISWEYREQIRDVHPIHPGFIFATWAMMCEYRWSKLSCDRRCPHQGIIVSEERCPGHGLIWDNEGRLKHRFSQLSFRATNAHGIVTGTTRVDWVWRDVIEIIAARQGYVDLVEFLADDEVLASFEVLGSFMIKGDVFKLRADC